MRKGVVGSALGGVVAGVVVAFVLFHVLMPVGATVNGTHPQMNVVLHVKVIDRNGVVKYDYVKEGDLLLRNWVAIQQFWFKVNADEETGVRPVNTGGNTDNPAYYKQTHDNNLVAYIMIGNGTTQPSINDYNLNNPIASFKISSVTITTSGNNMNLSVSGSWSSDGTYNVTEVGLKIYAHLNDSDDRWYLVFRDVLDSPITLNSGDTIAVTYTIAYTNPA